MGVLTDNYVGAPAPILRYFLWSLNQYSGGDYFFTASSAGKPPRQRMLEKLHRHKLRKDITELTFTAEGTALHEAIARTCGYGSDHDNGDWAFDGPASRLEVTGELETRLEAEVYGELISGQFDYYDTERRILDDWKRASAWSKVFGTDWHKQHMVNRVLLAENGYEDPTQCRNVAFYRDFTQSKAGDGKYPAYPIEVVVAEPVTLDECYAYVKERIRVHRDAEQRNDMGDALPLCTDEERWAKFRKGKPPVYMKCERYCDARPWCSQANGDSSAKPRAGERAWPPPPMTHYNTRKDAPW